jgi:hypothetical protein
MLKRSMPCVSKFTFVSVVRQAPRSRERSTETMPVSGSVTIASSGCSSARARVSTTVPVSAPSGSSNGGSVASAGCGARVGNTSVPAWIVSDPATGLGHAIGQ